MTEYIIRHSKSHERDLKYDFMPSLLEIIERPAKPAGKIIIWSAVTVLIAVVIWACVSKTDIAVTSGGTVVPYGGEITVQSQYTGTLSEINADTGDIVKKGDTLAAVVSSGTYLQQSAEYDIKSPCNGVIASAAFNSPDSVVSQGQKLYTIIPDDKELIMECQVKNSDIAGVHIGRTAEIRLDAYPYSQYGSISGKVVYISPDAETGKSGSFYTVRVKFTGSNRNIKIKNGLTGNIDIKTGNRRVISYFLDPITENLKNSMKE